MNFPLDHNILSHMLLGDLFYGPIKLRLDFLAIIPRGRFCSSTTLVTYQKNTITTVKNIGGSTVSCFGAVFPSV